MHTNAMTRFKNQHLSCFTSLAALHEESLEAMHCCFVSAQEGCWMLKKGQPQENNLPNLVFACSMLNSPPTIKCDLVPVDEG